jgi:hypothetical protein
LIAGSVGGGVDQRQQRRAKQKQYSKRIHLAIPVEGKLRDI